MIEPTSPAQGVHLTFLVHGLWGNPKHLENLAKGLRAKHDESDLRILVAKTNSDNHTYDGIEVGGERVARELEDEIERLAAEGVAVSKLSIVGYSLGGLIARYCVGLLFAKGLFDTIEPVNFTAFASPFLGTRTPTTSARSKLWNAIGARTLSTSGRQLWVTDRFRDTGRPLLAVLADPDSIFMRGLARFRHRVAYANVQNDRSAPFWTTAFAARDPYEDIRTVDLHFVPGYQPVVADPARPVTPKRDLDRSLYGRARRGAAAFASQLPFYVFATFIMPFGFGYFLFNAGLQSVRSGRRVRLHTGDAGRRFGAYQIPLMVEGALGTANAHAPRRHLTGEEAAATLGAGADGSRKGPARAATATTEEEKGADADAEDPLAAFPVLALLPAQFEMIDHLDALGFRKYHVLIQSAGHSHAAIVVRFNADRFKDGHVVIKHWVEEEFEI